MSGRPPHNDTKFSGSVVPTANAASGGSENVTAVENKTADANRKLVTAKGKDVDTSMPPPRPGYSNRGAKVSLLANCFELQPLRDVKFFRYNVKVTKTRSSRDDLASQTASMSIDGSSNSPQAQSGNNPENDQSIPKGRKLGYIMQHLLTATTSLAKEVDGGRMGSDFRNIIISTKKLAENSLVYDITYRGEKSRYHDDKYHIVLELTNDFNVAQMLDYINSTDHARAYSGNQAGNKNGVIQALNIMLRHRAKNESFKVHVGDPPTQTVVGSKTYSIVGPGVKPISLGPGVAEAFRGCFSSIRPAAGRLLVNVNITHGTFFKGGPLEDQLQELTGGSLQGVRVRLTHRTKRTAMGAQFR